MSAYSEAKALQDSLPETGLLSWEVGKVYNALLAAAKVQQPDSIGLAAMEALEIGHTSTGPIIAGQTAASLRVMVAVVTAALKPLPSFA